MASRSLRGMRLGSSSMETDSGVKLAPRQQTEYECPAGHRIVIPFSSQADIPDSWECRCGQQAVLRDGPAPAARAVRPVRTHWDMLLERRTVGELQVLLDERLGLLRAGMLRRSA